MGRGGVARDARSDGTTFGAYEPSHCLASQAMRERIPTDMTHRQVPNEGRDPKTLPRPSQCEANISAYSQTQHTTHRLADTQEGKSRVVVKAITSITFV